MKRIEYPYKGGNYTVPELSKMCGIPLSAIYNRLKSGWSIEKAVETPYDGTSAPSIEERWRGKKLKVVFRRYISEVFISMQPVLGKTYTAIPCIHATGKSGGCKMNYVIRLENGKPLIVYPGEFEIIGEAEE